MHFQSLSSYKNFQSSVQTRSRFILDDESNYFLKAIEDTCKKRIKTILTSEYLWRAQLGCDYIPLDQEGTIVAELPTPFEPKRMKPLNDRASEGRANPKGIPYLYVATDKETAMSEVRPSLEAILSIGRFKPTKELSIIDFSIPFQGPRKLFF
ncbi:hypothetical protein MNBD_GAMMA04-1269 [hydrothermal vent metagenome]|uniref:RES domain-containing protein n=1 Tax=hydrothermal vent metagenome TaxID=652676 RepID=A0A3B0W240_9ZZZZ